VSLTHKILLGEQEQTESDHHEGGGREKKRTRRKKDARLKTVLNKEQKD